jgi:hypothetical protein
MWRTPDFEPNRVAVGAGPAIAYLPCRITHRAHGGWSSCAQRASCLYHSDSLYLPLGRLLIRL